MTSGTGTAERIVGVGGDSGSGAPELQVEPEKLTQVAEVVEKQANALHDRIGEGLAALRIESPSMDIVSRNAVEGWNAVITEGDDSYYGRVLGYIQRLHDLAARLRAAAAQYDAGEHENAAALTRIAPGN